MGQNLISNDDVVIAANEPIVHGATVDDSAGDIVLRTSGVERARIDKSGLASGLFAGSLTILNVKQLPYGAAGDGVTNDTTAIQAALTAAHTAGGGTVYVPAGNFIVSASLVIYSNTTFWLDQGATITLKAGSFCNIIHNAAWVAGSGRDTNIKVIGGNFVAATNNDAPAGQARFLSLFQRVDRLYVADNSWTRVDATDVGRNIVAYACTGVEIARIYNNTGGVGVFVTGTSTGIHIHDIYGTAGDDFVTVQLGDPAQYLNGDLGDINGVHIHDIFPTLCQNAVKLLSGNNAGTTLNLREAEITNVVGNCLSTGSMVYIGGDVNSTTMQNGNIINPKVDRVVNLNNGAGHVVHVLGCGTGIISGLELSHIDFNDNATGYYTIGLDGSAMNLIVEDVTIHNCYWTGAGVNVTVSPVRVDSGAVKTATVGRVTLRDVDCNVKSLACCAQIGTAANSVTTLTVADSRINHQNQTGSFWDNHNATAPTLTNAFFTNIEAVMCNYATGELKTTTTVAMSNMKTTTVTAVLRVASGGSVTIGQADSVTGVNANVISNAGTVTGGHIIGIGYKATPTYGATVTVDMAKGSWQTVTATNGTAFTVAAATNPPGSGQSGELVVEVLNSSGGAMGAITWDATFKFNGRTWTNPANTLKRYARFEWNGAAWICTDVAGADY